MMKLSDMRTIDQVVEENRRQDPEFRERWDRTSFAREVAITVVRYRAKRDMSQRDLAAITGLAQPAIARIEKAEHLPSLDTLTKLSMGTGLEFRVDVARGAVVLLTIPEQRTSKATSAKKASKTRSTQAPEVSARSGTRKTSVRRSTAKSSNTAKSATRSALRQRTAKKAKKAPMAKASRSSVPV